MTEVFYQFCATDKEIYDLLLSGKQKLTERTLLQISRERGVFYSPRSSRQMIADQMSILPHDFESIKKIIERRDSGRGVDKTTSIVFQGGVNPDEIRQAIDEYQSENCRSERISSRQKGDNTVLMGVEYDEYDYSLTRLIQKQKRDAHFEFIKEGDRTVVRMPATPKAHAIIATIKDKIERQRKSSIGSDNFDLTDILSSEGRTDFFLKLITGIDGYRLDTVSALKVAAGLRDEPESDDEDDDHAVEEQMLAAVRGVALQGVNLLATEHFQNLKKSGFYITTIKWRSIEITEPGTLLQFDASFEDAENCTGFRYAIRYAMPDNSGNYSLQTKPIADLMKGPLFSLLEAAARNALHEVKSEAQQGVGGSARKGQ